MTTAKKTTKKATTRTSKKTAAKTADKPTTNGSDEPVVPTLPALTGESALVAIPSSLTFEHVAGLNEYLAAIASESAEILKFKKGRWKAGPEGDELPLGTEMAVDVTSISDGHVKWSNKRPVASDMTKVIAGPPTPRGELGDDDESLWPTDSGSGEPRDPWARTMSIMLKDPATFEQYIFSTSSIGGVNAIRKPLRSIRNGIARSESRVPIVALSSDSYMHPEFDEVFVPRLPIIAWKSEAELMGGPPEEVDPLPNDDISDLSYT